MESTNTSPNKLLYPLMVVAAIAVTLFSALGIAMMLGYLPNASSAEKTAAFEQAVDLQPRRKGETETATPASDGAHKLAAACANCGVVESIRVVEHRGSGSGLGAVAGGLAGALVGNQFGRGNGRSAMTLLGGAGGAYAGNEIEKNAKRSSSYEVRVRLDQGGVTTVRMASSPAVAVGDKVRLVNGAVVVRS